MNTTVDLRAFFNAHCLITCKKLDEILDELSKMGVKNTNEFRGFVSVWNLQKLGLDEDDINSIMKSLFATAKYDDTTHLDQGGFHSNHEDMPYISRLTR